MHRPLELGEHLLPDSRHPIASFSWNITVDRKRKANQNDTPSTENRETRQQTKSASSAVSRKNVRQKKHAAAVPVTKSVTLVEAAACLHTRFLHCSVCQNKFHQYTETTSVHFGQQEAHSYSNRIKTGSR